MEIELTDQEIRDLLKIARYKSSTISPSANEVSKTNHLYWKNIESKLFKGIKR